MQPAADQMKILHLASFDRWTGAAAVALAEALALREAGVQASYAYVGGYLMEERIGHLDWAYPELFAGGDPIAVFRSLRAIARRVRRDGIDIVHSHLSHDHWLARFAAMGRKSPRLVRTFHSAKALKNDPFSRWLIRTSDARAVVNPSLADGSASGDMRVTPPPLEPRYLPNGPTARSFHGIRDDVPVIGYIGKVSPGRGFEDALEAFGIVRRAHPGAGMLIVGHGPHQTELEGLAGSLDLADAVSWAGYHEVKLPEYFRAMDLMFFAAAGSDEGHRAIIEANACGTPVVSYPIRGVRYVIGDHAGELVTSESTPRSLALAALDLLPRRAAELRTQVVKNADRFNYARTADRLLELYESALGVRVE